MSKTTRGKKRSFRWLTLLVLGAVVLGAIQMAGRIDRLIDMNEQVSAGQVRLAEAQARYDEKMATIDLLDDPAYLERVARENLGMVKAGETIVSLVKSAAPALPEESSPAEEAED